jgi:hypothetical protein
MVDHTRMGMSTKMMPLFDIALAADQRWRAFDRDPPTARREASSLALPPGSHSDPSGVSGPPASRAPSRRSGAICRNSSSARCIAAAGAPWPSAVRATALVSAVAEVERTSRRASDMPSSRLLMGDRSPRAALGPMSGYIVGSKPAFSTGRKPALSSATRPSGCCVAYYRPRADRNP